MGRRTTGQEVLDSVRAIKRGEGKRLEVKEPDVKVVREKSGLSRAAFAALLGVRPRTLRDWEQGGASPPALHGPSCGSPTAILMPCVGEQTRAPRDCVPNIERTLRALDKRVEVRVQ